MTAEGMMRRALREARRALGRVCPNPAVGAVVFRGETALGWGSTAPPPGPHAEVLALERAARRHGRQSLRGASMAVTLEPCAHTGRTGPCTRAILDAGLSRVYVGQADPHPRVAGRGIRALRRAGLRVEVGLLGEACAEQHRGFVWAHTRDRPFVVLKLATSLDGRIATAAGESRWISGPESRALVHGLRDRADAVLVGSETVRADDPELTARRGERVVHRPIRVVVDSRLRVPLRSRFFQRPDAERSWVLTHAGAPASRRRARERAGARVLAVRRRGTRVDLGAALSRLAREGLTTLLVEGGGELAAALIRAGLVDELHWFLAPRLLGADAKPALGRLGVDRLAEAPGLAPIGMRRVGQDWHLRARVGDGGESR